MEKANIDIEYVAKLARIELTEEEKATYSRQLGRYSGISSGFPKSTCREWSPAPTRAPCTTLCATTQRGRAMPVSEALMNAPKARDNQISVPKVVEDA